MPWQRRRYVGRGWAAAGGCCHLRAAAASAFAHTSFLSTGKTRSQGKFQPQMSVSCKPCCGGVLTFGRQWGRGAGTELLCLEPLGSRCSAGDQLAKAVTWISSSVRGRVAVVHGTQGKQWYSGLRGGKPTGGQAPRASRGKNGGTAHSAVKKIRRHEEGTAERWSVRGQRAEAEARAGIYGKGG